MPTETGQSGQQYARGQALRLRKHLDHCADVEALVAYGRAIRASAPGTLLAADLFSGAGGMSLGLEDAGLKVVFGADFDSEALETHAHHFGGMSVGWDLGDPGRVREVGEILRAVNIDVIAGGPPCQPFSKAGRSRMRGLVQQGQREPHDRRRDLWQSYMEIVRLVQPRAVIMENVPDMALDREMFILRSIVRRLEDWGYSVEQRVVETYRYGVPQFRQRLILVALRGGLEFTWPEETSKKVTLGNAIRDLPPVEPREGWLGDAASEGWRPYDGPRTAFQKEMRRRVPASERHRVHDHVTRRVRDDDERAFEHLDSKTKYSELPDELKRYRDDIFDDKYKRLDADDLSRTITAHIAKDGYWYIHPEQNRTLTIREAARIQTFPDHFRFAGAPTTAFRQIGNAVPPKLGFAIGGAVADVLSGGAPRLAISSSETRVSLARWFSKSTQDASPWLYSGSRWLVILGETLLGGESPTTVRSVWPIASGWSTPSVFLANTMVVQEVASWFDGQSNIETLLELAKQVRGKERADLHDDTLSSMAAQGLVRRAVVELAMVVNSEGEEPVIATTGALRVAGRFFQGTERWLNNRNSDGRMAVSRLIGYDKNSRNAQLGLIEIGKRICTPKTPNCDACPLSAWCRYNQT